MPHSASIEFVDAAGQQQLLQIARAAVTAAAEGRRYSVPATDNPDLLADGAAFITLTSHGRLRGCIGSLEARQPLVNDVADNAIAAATRDPRFPPVTPAEVPGLHIEISVLTPSEAMHFTSQEDLLRQIRPNIDGLVLQEGWRRGTFLPLVWEQLPDKEEFLAHLKQKAGLPAHYWSDTVQVLRYQTQVFEE